MKISKSKKASIDKVESNKLKETLNKLEGGIKIKLNGTEINDAYNEKLSKSLDIDEPISTTLKGVKKIPKASKEKKPVSERGKKATEYLSKYREQVREALELKKKIENKNTLIYEDSEDSEEEEEADPIVVPPVVQPPAPQFDINKVYNDINDLKKQNKELQDRLLFRRDVTGISDLRRNMILKF
jgi:hypothetical protein